MTLTLEIPNDLSAQIERAAMLRGTDAPGWMLEAARVALSATPEPDAAQKRREAAAAGFGMFAGALPTVDEFLAERHKEAQAEAQKDGL